ncbi:MAG: hypothetical protein ACREXY_01310 [Gammaproteobacteria bacterium]
MANRPSLDDYVDVAERIQNFKDTNPDGTLQTLSWEVRDVSGQTFIVYHAAAYRTPDDERPGHGISWEPFPGGTPYTRNSELMNAETAAWGRAIIATGEASKGSLASRQEVRNRRAEQDAGVTEAKPQEAVRPKPVLRITEQELTDLRALSKAQGADWRTLGLHLAAIDVDSADETNEITKDSVARAIVGLDPGKLAELRVRLGGPDAA